MSNKTNSSVIIYIEEWFCWWPPELLRQAATNVSDFVVSPLSANARPLTHWGRVTHICVGKLTITRSDNGLSPGLRQAIIWNNAGILLIGPLGTNFSENFIGIQTFSFKKMPLKILSAKWRPFYLGLNMYSDDRDQGPFSVSCSE